MMSAAERVFLVTGCSRPTGLGVEVCRQLARNGAQVVLTARQAAAAEARAAELHAEGLDTVVPHPLDTASSTSIAAVREFLAGRWGRLDGLVNNAGGGYDPAADLWELDVAKVSAVFEVNLLGAWRMTAALRALLAVPGHACVANVSSVAGSFGNAQFGLGHLQPRVPPYALSKLALNGLTRLLAAELAAVSVKVNAVCPGYVATYDGAERQGARPVAEGARGIVWAATLPPDGPSGGFFRDGQPIPW